MFLESNAYTGVDAEILRPSLQAPVYTDTNTGKYNFLFLHFGSGMVNATPNSDPCTLAREATFDQVDATPDSGYGVLELDTDLPLVSASPSSSSSLLTTGPNIIGLTDTSTSIQMCGLDQGSTTYTLTPTSGNTAATRLYVTYQGGDNPGGGAYGVGGGTSLFDNDYTYTANSGTSGILNTSYVTSVAGYGYINNASAGMMLTYLNYVYANDSTNYLKKVHYIDVWYSANGGAYILQQTFTTSAPTLNGPTNEILTFTTPITLLGNNQDSIKVKVRTAWSGGYIWCTEIELYGTNLVLT
jgi:hypothetical protein